jgi:3-hydroxyisobutyrate dehydrogenase-like beta-hydroxyacid dehydrogenase
MNVAFIGLGIMGSRMAKNLLYAEHNLVVYNRTREKAERIIEQGAVWLGSPKEVVKERDVVITMLATPQVVHKVAVGKDGFLPYMAKNSVWIDCSTVDPALSRLMSTRAKHYRVRFIDAPVAGSKEPAEQGNLVFLAGGDKEDVRAVKPLFEAMGKAVAHIGENGMGTSMKMVVNSLLAQSMMAFTEACKLGKTLGIDEEQLFDTLLGGPVTAPFIRSKRSHLAKKVSDTEFPLQWMLKDLHLVSKTAYESGVAMPQMQIVKELFTLANANGWGDRDFSSIYHFIQELSGGAKQ